MPRRVDIDWGQLEHVFTMLPVGAAAYLDLQTGKVISWDGEVMDTVELEALTDDIDRDPDRYVEVVVPESHETFEWRVDFVRTLDPGPLRDGLEAALRDRKPVRAFEDALGRTPAVRARWVEFELARQRQALREWVEREELEPVRPPPW